MDVSLIWKFLVGAAIGEALWQTLKMVWEPDATKKAGKFHPDKLGVLAIGILISFGANLDLFAAVGIPLSIPYVGVILTGVLISRGAGFVHDLFTYLKSLKEIVLNKADIANMERTKTAIKLNKNLDPGTKVSIDTSNVVPEETKNATEKVKNMISGVTGSVNRVVKVIRSKPTINTEEDTEEKIDEDIGSDKIVNKEPSVEVPSDTGDNT